MVPKRYCFEPCCTVWLKGCCFVESHAHFAKAGFSEVTKQCDLSFGEEEQFYCHCCRLNLTWAAVATKNFKEKSEEFLRLGNFEDCTSEQKSGPNLQKLCLLLSSADVCT